MKTFDPEEMIKKRSSEDSINYRPDWFIQLIAKTQSEGCKRFYLKEWSERIRKNVFIHGWRGRDGERCCNCLKNYEILQDATIKLMEDLYSLATEYKNKDDVDNLLIDQGKMFCNDIIKTLEEFKV